MPVDMTTLSKEMLSLETGELILDKYLTSWHLQFWQWGVGAGIIVA
jgi:hypothetical protein